MAEKSGETTYVSPSVRSAARLLRRIAEGDAVSNMSQTARELNINRTTLIRLLHTLEEERFIEPTGASQGWRIGLGLIGLAAQSFFSDDLIQTAVPIAAKLAETLGLSSHLGILDGREVVYVVRRVPNNALVSNLRIGARLPAHAANMGRIMLAHMPAERIAALYQDVVLAPTTNQTPVTMEQLRELLDHDRRVGLAWSEGFFEPGISSVAAAVFDASDMPIAALNVSGQSLKFEGARQRARIGAAVKEAAEEISRRLGWHESGTPANDAMRARSA